MIVSKNKIYGGVVKDPKIANDIKVSITETKPNEIYTLKAAQAGADSDTLLLMATAMLSSGDTNPEIASGTPAEVISLMEVMLKESKNLSSKIEGVDLSSRLAAKFSSEEMHKFTDLNSIFIKQRLNSKPKSSPTSKERD